MNSPTIGIVVFPGSNCDNDIANALLLIQKRRFHVKKIWHTEGNLRDISLVVIPGGFSYGDYLRTGAIASRSPILKEIIGFAEEGKPILGICNGFQILLEAGILKGALLKNVNIKFVCKFTNIRVEHSNSIFTSSCEKHEILNIPIAHGEGNYFATPEILNELEEHNQVAFRYSGANGKISTYNNPNGSIHNIAGIFNKKKNVLGLMPHPERAVSKLLGSNDGLKILTSMILSF